MGRGVGRVTAWNTVGTVGGRVSRRLRPDPAASACARRSRSRRRRRPSPACSRCGGPGAGAGATRGLARRGRGPRSSRSLLPAWPRNLLAQGTGLLRRDLRHVPGPARRRATSPSCSSTRTASRRRSRWTARGPYLFYRSNGKTDASTDPGDMANQLLLGHLPMLLHPDPRDVFVLGLGTGVSAAAAARYPVRSIEIADIEGAAREATQLFARAEPQRPRRPARALPRRRRPQRAARARQDLRRDHLRPVRRLGRRRRQPLHAGVLRARALAPEARRRDGAVVPHALAAARADEAHRRDVPLRLPLRLALAPQPRRRHPDRQRRAPCRGTSRACRQRFEHGARASRRTCAASASGIRCRSSPPSSSTARTSRRMLADVPRLHTDDQPVVEYLSPRAGYVDTTTANDAGVQALQTKRLPRDRRLRRGPRPRRPGPLPARFRPRLDRARRRRRSRSWRRASAATKPDPKFLVGLGNQYRAKGLDREGGPRLRAGARRSSAPESRGVAAARGAPARRRATTPARRRSCAPGSPPRRTTPRWRPRPRASLLDGGRPGDAPGAPRTGAREGARATETCCCSRARPSRAERTGARKPSPRSARPPRRRPRARTSRRARATRCSRSETPRAPAAAFERAVALEPGRRGGARRPGDSELSARRRRRGTRGRARPRARARSLQRRGAGADGAVGRAPLHAACRRGGSSAASHWLSGAARADGRGSDESLGPTASSPRACGTPGTTRASRACEKLHVCRVQILPPSFSSQTDRCMADLGFSSVPAVVWIQSDFLSLPHCAWTVPFLPPPSAFS